MSLSYEQSNNSINQVPLWLLVELANELNTATNLETLQRLLACRLRWMINFDRCTLAVVSQPTDTEYVLLDVTSPSQAKSTSPKKFSLEQGWIGRAIAQAKPYFLSDLTELPSVVSPPLNADIGIVAGARSLMLLPLRVGERTIGSLNFSSHTPQAYSTNWRNLASLLAFQVGGQLSSVLAQEQTALALKALAVAQAKLKSAYEFRQRVMESATNAIYALDLQGYFTLVNRRMAEIAGCMVESLLGTGLIELFAFPQANEVQQLILAIAEQGVEINNYPAELLKKDGSRQMIALSLAPIFLDDEISAIVGTAEEIKARSQNG